MKNNVVNLMDYQGEDVFLRITNEAWETRRRERHEKARRARLARERKVRWVVNLALILALCAAMFAAGACWGST